MTLKQLLVELNRVERDEGVDLVGAVVALLPEGVQLITEVDDKLLDVLFLDDLEPFDLQVQGPDGGRGPPDPLMHRAPILSSGK